jgi:hypothetical protein
MARLAQYRYADRVVSVQDNEIVKISPPQFVNRSLAPLPKHLRPKMPKVS